MVKASSWRAPSPGPPILIKWGLRAAEREILKAFRTCLRDAGFPAAAARAARPPMLRAVCAGISGVDRRAVHRPLLAWMRRHIPARHYLLTSDAAIALAAAVRDAPGIIVIAGTGSIAFARDDQGKLLRAGGWGIPFDDRGSGYDLGRKAVAAALEAFDGRGPHTTLMERICRHLDLGDITEIISQQLEPQQVAALFPLVMEAAREGDLVARHLCDDAARDLADLAVALAETGRLDAPPDAGGHHRRSLPVQHLDPPRLRAPPSPPRSPGAGGDARTPARRRRAVAGPPPWARRNRERMKQQEDIAS